MFLWLSWGSTITQNSIRTISDLDRFRLTDTDPAENDHIGAYTDPEYRIDAFLVQTADKITIIHMTPVHQSRGVPPEVHYHLHSFESV